MAANSGKALGVGSTVDVEPPITDEEVLAEESSVGTQHRFSRSGPHADIKYLVLKHYIHVLLILLRTTIVDIIIIDIIDLRKEQDFKIFLGSNNILPTVMSIFVPLTVEEKYKTWLVKCCDLISKLNQIEHSRKKL